MKRFIFFIWLTFLIILPASSQDRALLTSVLPVLENYIVKSMAEENIPGAVVVVVKDGKVAYLKGFGVRVLGQTDPVDEHTPFALASVTKNFTNTLVARLVDQGKLAWNDKVIKYLPDFQLSDPKIAQEITLEDLLSHRSGLPDYTGDTLTEMGWSPQEIISALKLMPIGGEFRKTYEYQNVIVGLIGQIIEKVTGKPLAQVYEEELFQPIELLETRVGKWQPPTFWQKIAGVFKKQLPQPTFHDQIDGKTRYLPNGNPGLFTFPASSGIISTGHDLGKWLIFQLNKARINENALVSETNLNLMRSPHIDVPIHGGRQFPKDRVTKVQYGMGWFIHDYMGVPMLSHMGGMAGTRSVVLIIPQDNVGIAIMLNYGGMRVTMFPEAIRNKFLDLYLNVPEEVDWAKKLREDSQQYREKIAKQRRLQMLRALYPAKDLNDYVGIYENNLYGKMEIFQSDKGLILKYRDRPEVLLKHWNANTFDFNGSDLSFGFSGTDQGEITFSEEKGKARQMMISILHEGTDSTFHRVN